MILKTPKPQRGGISLLIDIENCIKAQQSAGYERWAKIENLKRAARTMAFLDKNGIEKYADLERKIAELQDAREKTTATLKNAERRLSDMALLIKNIETYRAFKPLYDEKLSIKEKLNTIATKIYRADGVVYSAAAEKAIKDIESLGLDRVPVCVAKTQYSLSDDPAKLGKPENFKITVSDVRLSNGAGFVVAYTGDIMTMPGLPKVPAANNIDVDENGVITGLF